MAQQLVEIDPRTAVANLEREPGRQPFRLVVADMVMATIALCVDPTYWISEEARIATGNPVDPREVLSWLWGEKEPSLEDRQKIASHAAKELQRRFATYDALKVHLPKLPATVVMVDVPEPAAPVAEPEAEPVPEPVQDSATAQAAFSSSERPVPVDTDGTPLVQIRLKPQQPAAELAPGAEDAPPED